MKKIYLFLIAMVMVAGVFAQVNINIEGTDTPPEIDGIIDEVWDAVEPNAVEQNFGEELPTVTAYFKILWDNENYYVVLEVEDDDHWPSWVSGGNNWEWDKPEIYFDVNEVLIDGGGAGTADNGHWQQALAMEEAGYDVPQELPVAGIDPGGVVAYSLTGENYVYEWMIPFANMADIDGTIQDIDNMLGRPIGFDCTVIDQDEGITTARQRAVWQATVEECWNSMDESGTITMVGNKVGAKNLPVASMNVYPNPVQDVLSINGTYNKVVISNIIGQEVMSIETSSSVNVSDLSKGVYVVKAYNNGELEGTAKITKN